jgi:hypothetical protein
LEKHIVSIFRAEVVKLGSGGVYIGLEEGNAEGVGQSEARTPAWRIPIVPASYPSAASNSETSVNFY